MSDIELAHALRAALASVPKTIGYYLVITPHSHAFTGVRNLNNYIVPNAATDRLALLLEQEGL